MTESRYATYLITGEIFDTVTDEVMKRSGIVKRLNELNEENEKLKEKNKFILGQIRAFRDDCYTAIDFDGASTLNRLLDILGEER